LNIGSLFARHARYRLNHLALVFGQRRLTYLEFNREINRLANALLALGVNKGDKVATLLPNCVELLEVYWAVAKIGAVVVPLSTLLREQAVVALLTDADAVMLVIHPDFSDMVAGIKSLLPAIAHDRFLLVGDSRPGFRDFQALKAAAGTNEPEAETVLPDDPFNIMYSSGTTGLPKGIVHTHRIRAAYGTSFATAFRITPESVTLHAGAIVFNGAFVDLMPTVFTGATYVLLPQFDPQTYIAAIAKERATHVMMVPSQIVALLEAPGFSTEALGSLEMVLSLGAPLHREHKERLNRRLPGRFYELYGLTEGFVTVLAKFDYAHKPDSVGAPPPFFETNIADPLGAEVADGQVGEICGRSPILMPGYYKRPDLSAQAIRSGWLHSGDLGYVDEDGFLYLVDRVKDMIISGGVNVYPRDIEEVVVQHPEVREAAVFGAPHDKWGETPVAAVVLRQPGSIGADALKAWVNAHVAAKYQRVSAVIIMPEFPRNVAGKILKRELRQQHRPPLA